VSSFSAALSRIKGNLHQAVPDRLIRQAVEALHISARHRKLTPEVTTQLALHRALHGGTAITHLRHFTRIPFTPSAFCQAMARLPEEFFGLLQLLVTGRLRDDRVADRWRGHRLYLLDGSSVSMPDTPELRRRSASRRVRLPAAASRCRTCSRSSKRRPATCVARSSRRSTRTT
jgi:hypothetical protein